MEPCWAVSLTIEMVDVVDGGKLFGALFDDVGRIIGLNVVTCDP